MGKLTSQALAGVFDTRLVVEVAAGEPTMPLCPEEEAAVTGWAVHRRQQFALGRECARRALDRLGFCRSPILFDQDGAPQWPAGAVGSLTHKRDQSLAIVARAEEFLSLGVDLEWDVEDESPDVALEVCTTRERARLPRIAASCRAPATLVLSAKEAFYKAQFPVCGVRLDWHDIEVRFDSGTFRVRALERLDLRARRAVGRYAVLSGWVITVVALQK